MHPLQYLYNTIWNFKFGTYAKQDIQYWNNTTGYPALRGHALSQQSAAVGYFQRTAITTNGPWSSHSSRSKLFECSTATDTYILLPPFMPTTGWTTDAATPSVTTYVLTTQPTDHPMTNNILSPVPVQICQKIIKVWVHRFLYYYIHRATFPEATADALPSTLQPIKGFILCHVSAGLKPFGSGDCSRWCSEKAGNRLEKRSYVAGLSIHRW